MMRRLGTARVPGATRRDTGRRYGIAAGVALAVLPLLAACGDGGFTPGQVSLSCPTSPGGPVTLAVGARANSPAPILPPAIVDLMRELRGSRARRHVREEVPFFTGRRRPVADIVAALP